MSVSNKHKRKIKYKKISFKFSKKEFEILEHCARLENTTINKFIKKSIRNELDHMMPRLKQWYDAQQPENQLRLFFDDAQEDGQQASMLEEYEDFYETKDTDED